MNDYFTNERIKELFNNFISHFTDMLSHDDLILTLNAIGFTPDEIKFILREGL